METIPAQRTRWLLNKLSQKVRNVYVLYGRDSKYSEQKAAADARLAALAGLWRKNDRICITEGLVMEEAVAVRVS
jgi:hypothetical protein